jgi:hypothetical protein
MADFPRHERQSEPHRRGLLGVLWATVRALARATWRIGASWRHLSSEQRQSAIAALGLFIAMFLPWYSKSAFATVAGKGLVSRDTSLSAFGDFSWVELAVLLIVIGILWMLFARGERRGFHLPGGDGVIIFIAGAWAAFLIFYRLVDKPGTHGTAALKVTIGVQWGIFVALAIAALLAYSGLHLRRSAIPEPPPPDPTPAPVEHPTEELPTQRL